MEGREAMTCGDDEGWDEAPRRPFDSLDSSREYVGLLLESIEEAAAEVGEDLRTRPHAGAERRHQAFQLVAHKLESLRAHVAASRRLLNELRKLRRLLHGSP